MNFLNKIFRQKENLYFEVYENFRKAIKQAQESNDLEVLRNSLFFFINKLKETVESENLDYTKISLFSTYDPKYFFPHQNTSDQLEPYGTFLEVTTDGLLIQILRRLDLERKKNLVYELEDALLDLHSDLSIGDENSILKSKQAVLNVLHKWEEMLNSPLLIEYIRKVKENKNPFKLS